MKKILFIFSFLFCALISMAQTFPNNNLNNSNPATLFGYQGGLTSNGYKLKQFSDTASANAALYLQFTPHLMIKVGNNIYVRNTAATQWVLIGGNFILNPGVDSVTLYGNTLCQWVSGVSTCYALNNSTFSTYATKGDFIYDSLLYFHNTLYQYYILGRYFTAPYTSHLLTPANPSSGRYDVGFVDTLNSASINTGVNGGGVPSTNPVSQLKISEIHINANDTIPSNFSNDIVYRFNNEWSGTSAISGIDFAYATAPFTGTSVSTLVPAFTNGQTISYARDTARDFSTASYVKIRLWLNASFTSANLNFSFNKAGNVATTTVPLLNGQFGYTSTIVGSWQEVNIPMAYFQYFDYYIDELVVGMTGANASGFKIGNIVIQFGGNPPPSSSSTGIIAVNGNYGPYVNFQYVDTGYTDVDTSNYVYKNRQTGAVLFTNPTFLKNLVSNRTAADTCIVLDTLGRTIFISFNPLCQGGIDATSWHIIGNIGTNPSTNFIGPTDKDSFQIKIHGTRSGFWDNVFANYSIGYNTLVSNTTGSENSAFGGVSLLSNTEGSENSAFGGSALIENLTGNQNSAFGKEALALSTEGSRNLGVGYQALLGNTTGSGNVGIGYFAGKYNIPAASNQVFINSINRINYLGDTTASPIWIQQDATVASQRIKINGVLHYPLGAGASKVLTSDASGYASWQTPATPTSYTASNGLTLTGSDFTLGGTLTGNTTIATGAFGATFSTATAIIDPLKAIATSGIAVTGTATNGTGIYGTVTSGSGVYGVATTGTGLVGTNTSSSTSPTLSAFKTTSATPNSVLNVVDIGRQTGGTAANGIGSSMRFITETSDGTNTSSNEIKSEWTDATTATATSKFTITGVNSSVAADLLTISGSGSTKLNKYGIGTFTGTPAYTLQVDASGNLIEGTIGAGVAWGAITGTLSNQTDLNTALGLKAPLLSPSFTTPTLGVATATSINKLTITAPTTSSTLTIVDGSSLITSGAFATTLTSTATTNATLPAGTTTLLNTTGSGASLTGVGLLATANTFTTNGAVSLPANTFNGTWYTGGSATTTKPYLLIETTGATSANWSTAGTGLAVNGASGFTGNLFDVQLNGAARFKIASTGAMTSNSSLTLTGDILMQGSMYRNTSNSVITIYNDGGAEVGISLYGHTHATLADRIKIIAPNGVGIGADAVTDKLEVTGNIALMAAGNKIKIVEGTNGSVGQTTLVAGVKAITITGVATTTRAIVTFVANGGTVTTTWQYKAVCTANTLTITAIDNTGATNTLDTSTLNYFTIN